VFRHLDHSVARRIGRNSEIRAIYAYEDGALHSFRSAEKSGARRLYDLPIGYWRAGQRIYHEEAERQPEWAATLTGTGDSPEKLERKDAELALADAVFVASTFTESTLSEAPNLSAPIYVVPYGAPAPAPSAWAVRPDGKLRVLFVGSLTQRKGLSYLLKAAARLQAHMELTLLGAKTGPCAPLEEALSRHRWIPTLSHGEVLREMARQDVLVFPSLFEGFGLVILEAMAQGLPVITTPHTAGPDIIEEGVDGFIVPIRDTSAIAERLELLIRNPERLRAMKEAACRKAAFFAWRSYRERLAGLVRDAIQPRPFPDI
jgi:glycosyltransferase involved in cell wall biosynthesis